MIQRLLPGFLLALVLCLASNATPAKSNITDVTLKYVPQQTVGQVEISLDSEQRARPVGLRLTDGRALDDMTVIGSRTDDDDRPYVLHATGEVGPFVQGTIRGILRDWGVTIEERADLQLELELLAFRSRETNQAVGATYESAVRLRWKLTRAGHAVASGASGGKASRYGKKFSNENTNEVLSDALLEAAGQLMSATPLRNAWAGREASEEKRAETRERVTPEFLLGELEKLAAGPFETDTILEYVNRKALSRSLNADELLALKQSGIADEVIRVVVKLPVR